MGAPVFIPFVGAWIQLKDQPLNADTEAYVGLGGPFAGTLASLACYFAARDTGSDLLLALSYAGFFINLFNLIPLSPFDGGRITAVLSPRVWLAGVPVLVALFFWRPSPMLIRSPCSPSRTWCAPSSTTRPCRKTRPITEPRWKTSSPTAAPAALVGLLAVMAHDVHEMLAGLR